MIFFKNNLLSFYTFLLKLGSLIIRLAFIFIVLAIWFKDELFFF